MPWHQFEQCQAAKQRKNKCAKETFPRFLAADVRDHQMPADRAAREIRAHVANFVTAIKYKT